MCWTVQPLKSNLRDKGRGTQGEVENRQGEASPTKMRAKEGVRLGSRDLRGRVAARQLGPREAATAPSVTAHLREDEMHNGHGAVPCMCAYTREDLDCSMNISPGANYRRQAWCLSKPGMMCSKCRLLGCCTGNPKTIRGKRSESTKGDRP